MKTLKLIVLVALAFTFSRCKTPTQATSTAQPSLLEVQQILLATNAKFLQYADTTNGNPWQAIMLTTNWVKSQPNVQSAEALDSTYINIILKSGLTTRFSFDQVDDSGRSIFRGGGQKASDVHLSPSGNHSKNTIDNKKVLIYSAANADFYPNNAIQVVNNIFKNSSLGLDVTLLTDEQCTPAIVDQFKDYGLVIIDTHGTPSDFMSGIVVDLDINLTTDAARNQSITQKHGQYVVDGLLNGDYAMWFVQHLNYKIPNWQKHVGFSVNRVDVTTKRIDKLASMPNTIVMGNMCYSGYQNALSSGLTPMRKAFMDKNPISYYCYTYNDGTSATVANVFAIPMEDSLAKRFVRDLDSTKIANLKPDHLTEYFDPTRKTSNLWFKHFGADDYSYAGCIDSFIDARDGHLYHAVCIGKQNWMKENLAFNAPGSIAYNNDPANEAIYGRLYNFPTVMAGAPTTNSNPSGVRGICPKGWHVPSSAEFDELSVFLGDSSGGKMKSVSGLWTKGNIGATNSSGFSALPSGGISNILDPTSYFNIGYLALFATTTIESGIWQPHGILGDSFTLDVFESDPQKNAVPCRCLKD